jgi:hypothetical protein
MTVETSESETGRRYQQERPTVGVTKFDEAFVEAGARRAYEADRGSITMIRMGAWDHLTDGSKAAYFRMARAVLNLKD